MAVPRIVGDHYLSEVVGSGQFGVVFYVTNPQNHVLAAKCISKSRMRNQSDFLRLEREISILQQISSPYVIKLHKVLQTDHNFYLIMEYCAGPSLETVINTGNLQGYMVRRWLTNVVDACLALKANNVMHRDLKPANVMLTHTNLQLAEAKLVDFGLAKYESDIEGKLEHSKVGSPRYMAPEIQATGRYSCNVDVYSFGKLAEEMVNVAIWEQDVREYADLMVQSALIRNPFERPSFEQIRQMPFFLPISVPIEINMQQHFSVSTIPIDQSDCDGDTAIFLSIYIKCCTAKEIWTLGWIMLDKGLIPLGYWLFWVYSNRIKACGRETKLKLAEHKDSGLEALLKETQIMAQEAENAIKDAESRITASDFPFLDQYFPVQTENSCTEWLYYEAYLLATVFNMRSEALQLLKLLEEELPYEKTVISTWKREMKKYLLRNTD